MQKVAHFLYSFISSFICIEILVMFTEVLNFIVFTFVLFGWDFTVKHVMELGGFQSKRVG